MSDGERRNKKAREPTVSPHGLVRRVISLHVDEDDELRRRAFEERRPVTELVREAVRAYLEMDED